MQFQILTLIIWPKNRQFPPQKIQFEAGKLNVITGSSRTGKSAIIPIIDYCLASSDCNIPIDTIRDFASWYGVVVQTSDEQILMAREVPRGNKVSNNFLVSREILVTIPDHIESPNENAASVKTLLNTLSSVPTLRFHGTEENVPLQGRLGFRDLMAFVFQNQDIVANQNIMFYKTHAHEHRQRLRIWFPYILGALNDEILAAKGLLDAKVKRKEQVLRELEKIQKIATSWVQNLLSHLRVAEEYGIVETPASEESTPEELVNLAKSIIEDIPDHSLSSKDDIEKSSSELLQFEKKEEALSTDIAVLKKRLSDLKELKDGLTDYKGMVKKRSERLQISEWLNDIGKDPVACLACGSHDHPTARSELETIALAFEVHEKKSAKLSRIPNSFDEEEARIIRSLENLLKDKANLQNQYHQLMAINSEAQKEFQTQKSMYLYLGHLEASLETYEKTSEDSALVLELENLEKDIERLKPIVDEKGVERRASRAAAEISQTMLEYLKILDVEDKYRRTMPIFDYNELNIKVQSNDGHWHFLAEVGSASNWVAFHLALMCSLQEFFLSMQNSPVPSFVIFDQPSQVYFPQLNKRSEEDMGSEYEDEDVEAVKKMFSAISKSIRSSDGCWQGIVLDHADNQVYGDIEGVHEVAVWRDGEKLIPTDWISNNSLDTL